MFSKGRDFFLLFIACVLLFSAGPAQAAGDLNLEKQMQHQFVRSRVLVLNILERMRTAKPYQISFAELTGMADEIKKVHAKLSERFEQQQADMSALGAKAADRHADMLNTYHDNIEEYIRRLESLEKSGPSLTNLEEMKRLLDRIAPARPLPIYGSLPYRHVTYAARKPVAEPVVTPAYRGGSTIINSADLASTGLAPISMLIATHAQSLGWNPASIYDWVKNNVKTEWYWGCMKGAEETLRQKSGNDCDQAALVAALLRASGFPVRYVRGVVEFFPDLESAKMQTGLAEVKDIASFFQKAGIPFKQVVAGGKVANFQIEHVWVEAQVPYSNYRGTVLDDMGEAWIGLDTSIKPSGYESALQNTDFLELALSGLRDSYLASVQAKTPLEYLRQYITDALPGTPYDSLLARREIVPEILNLLPASLQFKEIAVTGEYADLPEELVHRVKFTAEDSATKKVLFDADFGLYELSNRQVYMAYEPETVDDQQIINAYGGLDNTPGYLVRLRPVLMIEGVRRAISADGLAIGDIYTLAITLTGRENTSQTVHNSLITGNLTVIGIVAQRVAKPEPVAEGQKTGLRMLFDETQNYIDCWNSAENELAELLRLAVCRPTATVVTLAGVIDVTSVLDIPHGYEWKGVYINAGLRTIETAGGITAGNSTAPGKLFMQLSALEGSVLENRIFEDDFKVTSISTAKLFGIAAGRNIPVIAIDKNNIADLGTLLASTAENIKQDIKNAVNQNFVVKILQSGLSYEDWTGTGYIKENPATGEAGYMLTGMIAGGMTALGKSGWPYELAELLENPDTGLAQESLGSDIRIQKIATTDLQHYTVGKVLKKPLQVLVKDFLQSKPLANAQVTFTVKAGGGGLLAKNGPPVEGAPASITVMTNAAGIAEAYLVLGTKTVVNPSYIYSKGEGAKPTKVSQHVIAASVKTKTNDQLSLARPFTAFAFPEGVLSEDPQVEQDKANWVVGSYFNMGGIAQDILSFGGHLTVGVHDKYDNPVSNLPLTFSYNVSYDEYCVANEKPMLFVNYDDTCMQSLPITYGICESARPLDELVTGPNGTPIYVFMGNIPDATYAITYGGIYGGVEKTRTVDYKTKKFGRCSDTWDGAVLKMQYLERTNKYGYSVDAGLIGSSIPLTVRMYYIVSQRTGNGKEFIESSNFLSKTVSIMGYAGPTPVVFFGDKILGPRPAPVKEQWVTEPDDGTTDLFTANYTLPDTPKQGNVWITGFACISESCVADSTIGDSQDAPAGVSAVKIEVPEKVEVTDIDSNGYFTRDVTIDYKILPWGYSELFEMVVGYTPASCYVELYDQNDAVVDILVGPKFGPGSVTLAAGYKIDDSNTYRAQVVLNMGLGDLEMRSDFIPLEFRAVKAIYFQEKYENYPVRAGTTAFLEAETVPPELAEKPGELRWFLIETKPMAGSDQGPAIGQSVFIDEATGMLTVTEDCLSGLVKVRAEIKDCEQCYREAWVEIGCPSCVEGGEGVCRVFGNGRIELRSIDFSVSLGKAEGGMPTGDLILRSSTPSPALATPAALELSTLARDFEELRDQDKVLRQVVGQQGIVDIRMINDFSFKMEFYSSSAIGSKADDVYQLTGEPLISWVVENPAASADVYNQLKITEIKDGVSRISEYTWEEATGTWSLTRPDGLQIVSKSEETDSSGNRIVTDIVGDAAGNIAQKQRTTFHRFAWGEEVIESVDDATALTTSMIYYEDASEGAGNYKRLKARINPDGSWTQYLYDDQGRTLLETHSLLDTLYSDTAPSSDVRTIAYDYNPVDGSDTRDSRYQRSSRMVTETVQGVETAKTYHVYRTDGSGTRVEITERCAAAGAAFGNSANERTVRMYFASGTGFVQAGRVKSVRYADGRLDTYLYEAGTVSAQGVFTADQKGAARRTTVVHGTVASPDGIAGKSTKEVSIADNFGRELRREIYAQVAGAWQLAQWSTTNYDSQGRPTSTQSSDGTITESVWNCCGKDSDTDSRGITTAYGYDALKRVISQTTDGPQGDIVTEYTYDGAGRRIAQKVTAGGITQSTASVYDLAGRLLSSTDAQGLTTTYEYSQSGLVTTVTRPGGATEITERYLDGRVKSITGTGVIPRFYTYGVNSDDNTQWTKVSTGSETSPLWEKTTTDLLGRTVLTEKPGFTGTEITTSTYDGTGRLVKTSTSGLADMLYDYDELGNQVRSGLDINSSGALESASTDRLNSTDTFYLADNNALWQKTEQSVYAAESSGTPVTVSTQLSRLTGLGPNGLVAETIALDVNGNRTVSKAGIDRATKTETRTVKYPDSNIEEQQISVAGLVTSVTSKTGVTTTFAYDALGRRTSATDPRTGAVTTQYDAKGRVASMANAAGNTTTYLYDETTGRKKAEINADGKYTRYAYNALGQVTATWGDAAYPVKYEYDEYGRLAVMTTFREGDGWQAETFPQAMAGDATTWQYHEATGLLAAKVDAAENTVSYTYGAAGRLATRTWARTDSGSPVVTAYSYSSATGELTGIDYSDTTPDVGFTYDRLGRQQAVTDGAGSRSFTYGANLQLEAETITGMNEATITRTYDGLGRAGGVSLGEEFTVSYGYDVTGRFNTVNWTAASQTATASYGYVPGSDLLSRLKMNNQLSATYAYEPHRNLRTQIKNEESGSVISQYDYNYDSLGRRTSVVTSGQAFTDAAFNNYGYNDRSELTSSNRFLGVPGGTANPVTEQARAYDYDPIGNRTTATEAAKQLTYTANQLNQYDLITSPVDSAAPAYDLDGNLVSAPAETVGTAETAGTVLYNYDAENRLISVAPETPVDGATKVEYVYDYMSRRTAKKVFAYAGGAWSLQSMSTYVYDGWNLIREVTTPTPDPGNLTPTYYIWGLDLSGSLQGAGGIGGLLARVTSHDSLVTNYLYDGNGNVAQLVSSTGAIVAQYEYDPYGNAFVATGDNPFRFSTKFFDDETGLLYYGFRFYSPVLGRWLNRDPSKETGGINLYSFIKNNPINEIDAYGLWGSSIHRDATERWAIELGIVQDTANAIGQADDQIDQDFNPKVINDNNWSWHFNRDRNGDSRFRHRDDEIKEAKAKCKNGVDDPTEAARHLGRALHPDQDWVAHGDYNTIQFTPNATIWSKQVAYYIHNYGATGSGSTDWPDEENRDAEGSIDSGRPTLGAFRSRFGGSKRLDNEDTVFWVTYHSGNQRFALTMTRTKDWLSDFQSYVKTQNQACKCNAAFLEQSK